MSNNNFFQLIAEFQKNIDWLNQILKGGENDSVNIDGTVKPSISKDLADKLCAILAAVEGRLAFETKADMEKNTSQPVNTLAQVWNDPDLTNNKLYGWDGSKWVDAKYYPYQDIDKRVIDLEDRKATKLEEARNPDGSYPFDRDANGNIITSDTEWMYGAYIGGNGTPVWYPTFRYTKYDYPVKPGERWIHNLKSEYSVHVYDAQKQSLGNLTPETGVPDGNDAVFVMPENAAFVKLNFPDEGNGLYGKPPRFERYDAKGFMLHGLRIKDIQPDEIGGTKELPKQIDISGFTYKEGYYLLASGDEKAFSSYCYCEDYIPVEGGAVYTVKDPASAQGVMYNAQKEVLGDIKGIDDEPLTVFTTHQNAAFVRLNFQIANQTKYFYKGDANQEIDSTHIVTWLRVKPEQIEDEDDGQWSGKKIAWYGTSIPAGYPHHNDRDNYSYANKSIMQLSATPQNYCVPNGTIRLYKYDGGSYGGPSFLDLNSAYNYQNSMVDLIGTDNEPDLFVFDYGVNDAGADQTDINMIDLDDPYTTEPSKLPIDTRDNKTFVGSYNFVIDKLLTANPRARFAFVTHFSNDERGGAGDKDEYKKMNQVIELLAEHWNAPVLKMHRKTGWVNRDGHNLVTVYNPDGIHPYRSNRASGGDFNGLCKKIS